MFFHSIRSRLTAWYVAMLAIILIVFSVSLYLFLSQRLYESIDNSLKVTATVAAKTLLMKHSLSSLPSGLESMLEQFLGQGDMNKFYRIYDGSGNVGSRSRNIDAAQFPLTQEAYARALEGESSYETITLTDRQKIRMITMPIMRGGAMANLIQVGTSLAATEDTLRNLKFFLYAAIPAILALATLVGRFMARRALRPVDEITRTARDIGGGSDLSKRLAVPEAQDEIGRLVVTFNDMLSRLNDFFTQVRQFSSDASHELRTPLTVLKGQSELALSKARAPREYQETLMSNLEEINYMSKIIEDLFYLTRADESNLRMECKPVELRAIVEEVCRHAELMAGEKNLRIVIASMEPVEIGGDAVRLKQMLWNLLNNAIKYTPSGGEVRVTLQGCAHDALLTVEDTGIGIAEEHLPLIFNRFYRVDKARARSEGGSGLGLSICKYIVEAHKGGIEVESKAGLGTKFRIRLPKSGALPGEA